MFETASFHIVKPCNMKCKFCYATFDDMKVVNQLPKDDAYVILRKLKEAGIKKITFAGGEPLLYRNLGDVIGYAHEIGLTTSIITNGYLLDSDFLKKMVGKLDWIGVSIDSVNLDTNEKIGRVSRHEINYTNLI
jgi:radical S-adenosyl methionine domain-containing protein 2